MPEPLHEGNRFSENPAADWLRQLFLLGGRFLGTKTCIGACSEFGLELFDSSGGIHELELAGVERVADVANVDAELFANAASLERIAATAGYFGFLIVGMDVVFHDFLATFACVERRIVDWKLK